MRLINIALILIFSLNTFSQVSKQKERLASSYESSGDFENAARLYLEIYKSEKNQHNFNNLARNYLYLNQYSDLLEIAETHIEDFKNGMNYNLLGELYWQTGDREKGNENWQIALNEFPDKITISEQAEIQTDLQLFDKAISTLIKGRELLKSTDEFAEELSRLFIYTGNYRKGVSEVILLIRKTGNIPLAQGRLYALMTNKEAEEYIYEFLSNNSSDNKKDLYFQELFAWFLNTTGKLDKALEVYINLDRIKNQSGREVLNFANLSRGDGNYSIALKAFEYLIDQGKEAKYTPSALYGYARTLEQMSFIDSDVTDDKYEEIIERYNFIITEYPRSQTAAECLYRIAYISWKKLGDLELARIKYKALTDEYKNFTISAKAALNLGELELSDNRLSRSINWFREVIDRYASRSPEDTEKANFMLAEILYFTGEIDSALAAYNTILQNTQSDVANDALKRVTLIQNNKEFIAPLQEFAKGEYLLYKDEPEEALDIFINLKTETSGSDLAQQCYLRIASIYRLQNKEQQAFEEYEKLLIDYPETIYGDYCFIKMGDIYLSNGSQKEAEEMYTKLLVNYPKSIYLQEAREKIKKLRNKEI